MWPYYGGKGRIAHRYPTPEYSTIIEPFAGAARYSLRYWDQDVILIDNNPIITRLWQWGQRLTEDEVVRMPILLPGQKIPTGFQQEWRWLYGFAWNHGSERPRLTAGKFVYRNWNWLLEKLPHVRHWCIGAGEYTESPDVEATWFIDPPYQHFGKRYPTANIKDYKELGKWCLARKGQLIVCEKEGADWLPFRLLVEAGGQRAKQREVVFTRSREEYERRIEEHFAL